MTAPLLAQREEAAASRAKAADLKKGLTNLFGRSAGDSNTPAGDVDPVGRRLRVGEGFTIYGGGRELLLDADGFHLWDIHNNGGDGDNWGHNNVSTGGAGAIGARYPLTPERRALVERHWPETPTGTNADNDTADELDTL